jgi:hypothetical protein
MQKLVDNKLVDLTPEEEAHVIESRKPDKEGLKLQLWQACNSYQDSKISVGGMIELKPFEVSSEKCKAIRKWIKNLWTDYYSKKGMIDQGISISFDFSDHGDLPFTYLEAATEAGVI